MSRYRESLTVIVAPATVRASWFVSDAIAASGLPFSSAIIAPAAAVPAEPNRNPRRPTLFFGGGTSVLVFACMVQPSWGVRLRWRVISAFGATK